MGGSVSISASIRQQPGQQFRETRLVPAMESDSPVSVAFAKPFVLLWEPPKSGLWDQIMRFSFRPNRGPATSTLAVSTDYVPPSSKKAIPPRTARFWLASESSRECLIGEFSVTSLLTFHGQTANPINIRSRHSISNQPLVHVLDDSIVSIYANVGMGRYLTVSDEDSLLSFITSPQQIRADPALASCCEFRIRRYSTHDQSLKSLKFGDVIVLESIARPGWFLTVDCSKLTLVLTQDNRKYSRFTLHSPTLRELVQLTPEEHSSDSISHKSQQNDFELAEQRMEAERERQWMEAIARNLPLELAMKIFSYHADFIRTARLVSKTWQQHAEMKIKRIRVNGEFCSLETDEERAGLVAFVRRCPHLEVLTLRNVISLSDDDVAKMTDNRNLISLILGGCRRISDKSTLVIADNLVKLNHLNMAFTNITDVSLRIMAEKAVTLKELNLYNCTRVTVEGINRAIDIENALVHLEHINLRGTVVDSHLVQRFRRKRPDVTILTGPASPESIWG